MQKSKTTHWSFYIDESGDFENPAEQVLLAGVLIADNRDQFEHLPLRQAIRNAVPLVLQTFHRWSASTAEKIYCIS